MKTNKYLLIFLLGIFCLLSIYCTGQKIDNTPKSQPLIRVGYLRLLSAIPLYTAIREGYFTKEGINVELRVIKSGPEGNEAIAAGNIDVAFSILPSLIVANDKGIPSDLVSIYGASIDSQEVRDHRIIVPVGSKIHKAEDLRNKKVAVVGWPGMTSDVLELLDYFDRHNINPKDVTLVGMPHGDMVANLQSGVIDAAACAEPYVTLGSLQNVAKPIEEDEGFYYSTKTEVTTYLARRSWIDSNKDAVSKFVRALKHGAEKSNDQNWLYVNGLPTFNKKNNPPIDFIEITPEQAKQLRLMPILPMPTEQGLRHVSEQLIKRGAIKQSPTDLKSLLQPIND